MRNTIPRCDNGKHPHRWRARLDISFDLPDPAYEAYTWRVDDEHAPAAQPPLTRKMFGMGAQPDGDVPGNLNIGGYSYWRVGASHEGGGSLDDGLTALERWREKWLPQVERAVASMKAFTPADVPDREWTAWLDGEDAEFGRIFGGVHRETVFPVMMAATSLMRTFEEEFGGGREVDAHALMHGFSNATRRRAEALWELSRMVRGNAETLAALQAWPDDGGATSDGEFGRAFQAFLVDHGETLDGNLLDMPTWVEDPAPVVQMLLKYTAMPDGTGPPDTAARAEARRMELEAEVAAKGSDALKRRLKRAQERVIVGEDHNVLNDQRMFAAARGRWLTIGGRLVELGGAARPDDVFLYEGDELGAALDGGAVVAAEELAFRRETLAAFRAATPPRVLGKPLEENAPDTSAEDGLIHGTPASAGSTRARARVVSTLADAGRLQPGEVLVAAMTMPAWTPLFAVAGAVVTDAGGVLSHPAVVAREFGIPAVVGAGNATARIADGDMVTVDGTAGTIEIEGP